MTSFANCGNLEQTLLMLLMFAAALLQLFLTIEVLSEHRNSRFLLGAFLLLAELYYCGTLIAIDWGYVSGEYLPVPTVFLWSMEGALLICAAVSYICTLRKTRYSLSRESIKEGSDNLPDGVCFFDEHGAVRLINRKMLSVGVMLFGSEIQTLDELHNALRNPPDSVECLDEMISLYRFPDGTVLRFTERATVDRDGSGGTEVIASDVTELYAKQAELNRENARLADTNRKMKRLLDNMTEIVREEEILYLKMRVHDDIGHSILSARKALLEQQDIAVIHENATLWETAVDLLYLANSTPPLPDEWEAVVARAGELGVEIALDGRLPEHEFLEHLLILALRECVTNCVRHAGGNKVFVALTSGKEGATWTITNNGKAPEQAIVEGGGLSGLRRRIERAGGMMKTESSPRFALIVTLPPEEELL